jgi:hypothetical protein
MTWQGKLFDLCSNSSETDPIHFGVLVLEFVSIRVIRGCLCLSVFSVSSVVYSSSGSTDSQKSPPRRISA